MEIETVYLQKVEKKKNRYKHNNNTSQYKEVKIIKCVKRKINRYLISRIWSKFVKIEIKYPRNFIPLR